MMNNQNVISIPSTADSDAMRDVDLDKLRRDIQHTVGYFEGLDIEVIAIIDKLRKFQHKYPRLKFHMFMESEMDSDQCPGKSFRVLYSPTIVLSDEKHKPLVHQITTGLSLLSSMSETSQPAPKAEEPTAKSIFNISSLPSWFPGSPNNGLDERPLILDESIAARFETLSPALVARMYELFFQEAFDCVKRNCRSRLKATKVKVYESFTAPWYKRIIKVGYRTNTADSRVLQNKRQLRQQLGRQRMAWTLACFYQFEAAFSRGPLEYLMRNANDMPKPDRSSGRRPKNATLAAETANAATASPPAPQPPPPPPPPPAQPPPKQEAPRAARPIAPNPAAMVVERAIGSEVTGQTSATGAEA